MIGMLSKNNCNIDQLASQTSLTVKNCFIISITR